MAAQCQTFAQKNILIIFHSEEPYILNARHPLGFFYTSKLKS